MWAFALCLGVGSTLALPAFNDLPTKAELKPQGVHLPMFVSASTEYKIYWMNLEARNDRATKFTNQLSSHNLLGKSERFTAVNGKELSTKSADYLGQLVDTKALEALVQGVKYDDFKHLTWGGVGVAASHLNLWKMASSQKQPLMVFEDDATLSDVMSDEAITEVLKGLNLLPTWDLCFFGAHGWEIASWQAANTSVGGLYRVEGDIMGLYGYLVNPNAVSKLQANLFPTPMQIDTQMSQVNKERQGMDDQERLNIFAVVPRPFECSNPSSEQCSLTNSLLVGSPKSQEGDSDIQPESVKNQNKEKEKEWKETGGNAWAPPHLFHNLP